MTAPLFYVDALPDAGSVELAGDDARHAAGSLRLRVGEPVLVGDGAGKVATCTVVLADRRHFAVRVETVALVPAPAELTVVQAIPKGERGDLALELLTETGVSRIVPWASARTVPDWRGKEAAKVGRWRRVALAAAKQSRRSWLPQVDELLEERPAATYVLHEQAEISLFDVDLPDGPITVVVGPEGGLADDEIEAMGGASVRLGAEVMRTSTAGAAACVWIRGMQARRRSG